MDTKTLLQDGDIEKEDEDLIFNPFNSNNKEITEDEVCDILAKFNFNDIKDDIFGIIRDAKRLLQEFSYHKGDFFKDLIGTLIEKKQTSPIVNLPICRNDCGNPNCISSPRT